MTATLGVIGAGAGAAAATYVVGTARPDVDISVFEKSRGVCGRAAARRREASGHQYIYDYGANYLQDTGGRVSTLVTDALDEGLVEIQGPIGTFDASGNVSLADADHGRRWTYEDGITRLAKHLFGRGGVEVERDTRIVDVRRAGGWRLTDAGGNEHGPFDTLLLNPPAPQTANLLRETGGDAAGRLGDAAGTVGYKTVWTAILGYDVEIAAPYYGLVGADPECTVRWIGREEQKPGHVPDGASVLVVQAGPEWATERYDVAPAQNIADLAHRAAEIMGDRRVADPDWTDHQGWKYALPEAGVPGTVRREAAQEGVYVTGDWVAGEARLHAALRNGLETGDLLVSSVFDD